MDCVEFYEQVVRLTGIADVANEFVLIHLSEIQNSDVKLFEFDFDVTMMIFFMNGDEQIYGRYGGRDETNADAQQSLAGLKYAMKAAIDTHCEDKPNLEPKPKPVNIRDLAGGRSTRGCIHCHTVKEIMHRDLELNGKWSQDEIWRFPPPRNVGFDLDVDQCNVVKRVAKDSAADKLGLQVGDVVDRIGNFQVRSFGDAQNAFDKVPKTGSVEVSWRRGIQWLSGDLALAEGWRRTDQSWRPSMQHLLASPRMFGVDLTTSERKSLGLSETQLAFRHRDRVLIQAEKAGIKAGDIVLGFDGEVLDMDTYDFQTYVRKKFLVGDSVDVNVIRGGERLNLKMTFME